MQSERISEEFNEIKNCCSIDLFFYDAAVFALNKFLVFFKHLMDHILCVYTEMFLVFSGKLFYVDWFAVFQNDMSCFDFGHMCLKDFGGVVHSHRNDRASGFAGDFETSFMERKELQLVCICVSSTFREDTDGDAGFYFFDRGQDSLQSLFDIFSVKEQTVKIAHPVRKKRVSPFLSWRCNQCGAGSGCS